MAGILRSRRASASGCSRRRWSGTRDGGFNRSTQRKTAGCCLPRLARRAPSSRPRGHRVPPII